MLIQCGQKGRALTANTPPASRAVPACCDNGRGRRITEFRASGSRCSPCSPRARIKVVELILVVRWIDAKPARAKAHINSTYTRGHHGDLCPGRSCTGAADGRCEPPRNATEWCRSERGCFIEQPRPISRAGQAGAVVLATINRGCGRAISRRGNRRCRGWHRGDRYGLLSRRPSQTVAASHHR